MKNGHLILTRRINETIMFGDDIEMTILGVKGNQVRISIKAPENIPIWREEIYRRIQAEKEQKTHEQEQNPV